ncbi:MAG: hypothetical protein HFJ12_01470 [Bacilli bacterium]|nr:hypothetical protein [Bacilli bacterium]
MFKKDERKTKEYKGNTIYLTRYEDIKIEKYLDILVRSIESYVKQKGIMPQKIKLGYNNYNRILEHNKNLIEKKDNKYFTFGVEIEV